MAAPGCRVSTASYMASMLRPEVIRDLELDRHGLRMVAAEPTVQAVTPDGEILAWWSDRERMREFLLRFAPADCERFLSLGERLGGLARHLEPLFMQAPPDLQRGGLAGLCELLRFAFKFRRLRGREIADLVAFATGSLGEFLDRSLESPHLKSLVLANSLYGKHGGPYDPGTLFGLLFHLLGGGAAGETGLRRPRDGRHGRHHPGDGCGMRCARRGAANGCGGETDPRSRRARETPCCWKTARKSPRSIIVSNADPKRTFLGLVPARGARHRISRGGARHQDGWALRQTQSGARGGAAAATASIPTRTPCSRAQFTLVPWLEGAQRCYEQARQGKIAERLWIDCLVPSLIDPSLATPGHHVMTCFMQYLPYRFSDSSWGVERDRLHRQLLRQIAELRTRSQSRHWSRAACIRRSISRACSESPRAISFTVTCGPTSFSSCARCRRMRATRRRSARCISAAPARTPAAA